MVVPLPTPGDAPDWHPGSLSSSVEMPFSVICDASMPRVAAVADRKASANAVAAGLVAISSGVKKQSSNALAS